MSQSRTYGMAAPLRTQNADVAATEVTWGQRGVLCQRWLAALARGENCFAGARKMLTASLRLARRLLFDWQMFAWLACSLIAADGILSVLIIQRVPCA